MNAMSGIGVPMIRKTAPVVDLELPASYLTSAAKLYFKSRLSMMQQLDERYFEYRKRGYPGMTRVQAEVMLCVFLFECGGTPGIRHCEIAFYAGLPSTVCTRAQARLMEFGLIARNHLKRYRPTAAAVAIEVAMERKLRLCTRGLLVAADAHLVGLTT